MNSNEILLKNVKILSELSDIDRQNMEHQTELPSVNALKRIVELAKQVFFPGFFDASQSNENSRYYHVGANMDEIFNLLKSQVKSESIALEFINRMPEIKRMLYTDIDAMLHSDPAVKSQAEIILCYPFVQAMLHYRIAHELLVLGVQTLPRIITEMAHSLTGIDIHPGAKIGEYFCIDHGTGVVIGETCIIGNHVMLYQGVTLGAKSFTFDENGTPLNTPRHPILEDNVTVYSNSSVLGRITIGHDTIIGGNVWLTNSVAPYSKIMQSKAVAATFTDGAGI
ncbi:MAG: serine acetyltransferase [Bacteroidales bacterium]|nr:serine acetyltransferase [Bacteroidales bacterium]